MIRVCRIAVCIAIAVVVGCGRSASTPDHSARDSTNTVTGRGSPRVGVSGGAEPLRGSDDEVRAGNESAPHLFNRVVALHIAIDRYESLDIAPLSKAESESRALADVFENRFGYDVDFLLGADATAANIVDRINFWDDALGASDALIVHFSGHGRAFGGHYPDYGYTGYLLPYDSQLPLRGNGVGKAWKDTVLEMRAFATSLRALDIGHVVFLADSCCSGFVTKGGGSLGGRSDLATLIMRPSCSVVSATTEDGSADEGVFTPELIEQLRRARAISLHEVFLAVREGVITEVPLMVPHHSQLRSNGGDFVFLALELADAEVDVQVDQLAARFQKQLLEKTNLPELLAVFDALDYRFSTAPTQRQSYWSDALRVFETKASTGSPVDTLAQAAVFYCYDKGLGVDSDSEKAYRAARKAYDTGSAAGKFILGDALMRGVGIDKNGVAGRMLVAEAAEAGFPLAEMTIGHLTLIGATTADERQRGIRLLEKSANAGVNEARVKLATAWSGVSSPYKEIQRQPRKAIDILRPAVAEEDPRAMFLLATLCERYQEARDTVSQKEAATHLFKAAEAGLPDAQVQVGKFHFHGVGVPRNIDKALKWFTLAEAQDFAAAHDILSTMHEEGVGVELDYDLAAKHGLRAVELGDVDASARMARHYLDGTLGLTQNDTEAFKLFRKAASLGDVGATYMVAAMYSGGRGVSIVDPAVKNVNATHWFMKAARLGHDDAVKMFRQYDMRELSVDSMNYLWSRHPESAMDVLHHGGRPWLQGRRVKPRLKPPFGEYGTWQSDDAYGDDKETAIARYRVAPDTQVCVYAGMPFVPRESFQHYLSEIERSYLDSARQVTREDVNLQSNTWQGQKTIVRGTHREWNWEERRHVLRKNHQTIAVAIGNPRYVTFGWGEAPVRSPNLDVVFKTVVVEMKGPEDEVSSAKVELDEYLNTVREGISPNTRIEDLIYKMQTGRDRPQRERSQE